MKAAPRCLAAAGAGLYLAGAAGAATGESAGGGARDLLWATANFALLIGVLFALGRKPIRSFFEERRSRIHQELDSAASLLSQAEERHASWQRQLSQLDAQLEEIRQGARQRAESERERILSDARAAAERIRADASASMEQELLRARETLRRDAAELAVEIASERLRGEVNEDDRDRLIDEFIQRVEAPPGAGAAR